jgi:hypothetical protein
MAGYLPPRHPDQPEEVLPDLPDVINDVEEDKPRKGDVIAVSEWYKQHYR